MKLLGERLLEPADHVDGVVGFNIDLVEWMVGWWIGEHFARDTTSLQRSDECSVVRNDTKILLADEQKVWSDCILNVSHWRRQEHFLSLLGGRCLRPVSHFTGSLEETPLGNVGDVVHCGDVDDWIQSDAALVETLNRWW
ncbi:hypothetical protein GCK72_013195 [Caenorhabditis remanei]|uniref:Uncharacterized protein n=1 Tax=Caenorhabditis remanei TaxID=31234 RepID=A0A6A5GPY5_CAERE|nr:hypothetical protein GCK72_013195 [Caenorhabditis remanei]KAF1756741.1 hypothetical protein GCK72_013195 [Caenorhabditis remanei]